MQKQLLMSLKQQAFVNIDRKGELALNTRYSILIPYFTLGMRFLSSESIKTDDMFLYLDIR